MGTGASIGSSIMGGAGLITGISAGNKADSQMSDAIATKERYGNESLAYSQGLMDSWEETFGGIEANLSEYYNNLDPDKYAMQYKTNLYGNIDKQMTQLNDSLSAQGLQSSGMRAQAEKEAAFGKATGSAEADIAAEDKVASMQQSFVNTGENRRASAESGIQNSYRMLSGVGDMQADQSRSTAMDAGGFVQGGLDMFSGAAGNFAQSSTGQALEKKWFG